MSQLVSKGLLTIHKENIFNILKKSLYDQPDVVFRELVSNALDAHEKRKLSYDSKFEDRITVTIHSQEKTLSINDSGIGMTADEVDQYINQIAFSGAQTFIDQEEAGHNIIGHFGVGFYSAFMYAYQVTIDTLSAQPGAQAVHWSCDEHMAYHLSQGSRQTVGTTVTLHLSDEAFFLDNLDLAKEALIKYFPFAKTPIFFQVDQEEAQQINHPRPVWKDPQASLEDQQAFYKSFFQDDKDYLFSLPFKSLDLGLRGILYFRDTKHGTEELDGTIKVYNRGVYIGENMAAIIPKYINLQHGIIECSQLDLAVSRSNVRADDKENQMLSLIAECLTQEVAIYFNELFTQRRASYEKYWPEIHAFVKFGVLQDKIFSSVMAKKIIFEDLYGQFHTLQDYIAQNDKVYYVSDRLDQAHYIELFKQFGRNALIFDHVIDQPLLYRYEVLFPKVTFSRLDSDLSALFKDHLVDSDKFRDLEGLLKDVLADELFGMQVSFVDVASQDLSLLLINDEETRRITDMLAIYGVIDQENLEKNKEKLNRTLIVNVSNPTLTALLGQEADNPLVQLAIHQLFDLALISQQALNPDGLEAFIQRSERLVHLYVQQANH